MRKSLISFLLVFLLCRSVLAETYGSKQLIQAGHWIYEALYTLYTESNRAFIADSAPLSVEEIQFHLSKIEPENLSYSGQELYKTCRDFLEEKKFTVDLKPFSFAFNVYVTPQFMAKSNPDLDWSFATDYTGKKLGVSENPDNKVTDYGAGSNYQSNRLTDPLLKVPFYFNFADFLMIEADPSVGKNFWGMSASDNFCNIPLADQQFEFLFPIYAYLNTGKVFDKGWCLNAHIGKEGYQLGHTKTGSLIYNNTFQTDGYFHLGLTSPSLKYEMVISEVDHANYFYMHDIDVVLFKHVKFGVVEGNLVNGPIELRHLNPLMIMHQFGSWEDYADAGEKKYYNEGHMCSYFGIKLDVVPCKNLRLYFLYAQNEIQPENELGDDSDKCRPDSLGFQIGAEYILAEKSGGYFTFNFEGVYTTPFLYIKQGADWSLYRKRFDMQDQKLNPICSWMGSPFGPDCVGFQISAEYRKPLKYSIASKYLFVAHGTNSFGLFNSEVEKDGKYYNSYYPSAMYRQELLDWNAAHAMGRSYALTGVVQYYNAINVSGEYTLNDHVTFRGNFVYAFVFNNKNIEGNFAQGVEVELSAKLTLF